jgi:hypothetical protein
MSEAAASDEQERPVVIYEPHRPLATIRTLRELFALSGTLFELDGGPALNVVENGRTVTRPLDYRGFGEMVHRLCRLRARNGDGSLRKVHVSLPFLQLWLAHFELLDRLDASGLTLEGLTKALADLIASAGRSGVTRVQLVKHWPHQNAYLNVLLELLIEQKRIEKRRLHGGGFYYVAIPPIRSERKPSALRRSRATSYPV